jgi:zinc protease
MMNTSFSCRRTGFVLCAALVFGAVLSFSNVSFAEPAATPLKVPNLKYEKYTLPNGLEVILREDHRLPLVAVDLWYHVGPVNEKAGRTGFAHLFEHMMFEGSEHVGEKAHFKYLEGAGATDINGSTSYDRTNYFETVPSNELDLALWLESDRMGFLLETLDRAKLTNQRDVVRNELRQDEGNPYDVADEAVGHLLFPKGHPYYGNVIGSHADVEAARLLDVRDFFQHFYTPNNASIAIVGDFDAATIKEKVAKFFAPIPKGPTVEKAKVDTPAITTERRVTVTDTVQLPRLSVAWLAPEAFHPGDADTDMFVSILGGGKVSRLYQKLVYQTQIAQSVSCGNQSMMVTSIVECDIIARPNVKLEDLEAAFDKEVEALRTSGPTQAELDRARNQHLSGLIQGLQQVGGVADMMDRYNQYLGEPGYLSKDVARYEAVTTATVQKIAQQVFAKNQRAVVYCAPGKKVTDDVPRSPEDTDASVKVVPPYSVGFETAQSWRKEVPKSGPEPKLNLPTPKILALNNGMKIYLIEEHELPVVSASLVTLAGGENNPKDKPGLAAFTARLLTEGTATRSSTQLANDIAQIGGGLSSSASMDSANVSVAALSNNTGPALELLSDVALHPAFKDEEVERIRQQRLVAILQEGDEPVQSTLRVGQRVLYGDQPYGFQPVGTTKSVKAITRADLSGFWAGHYGPNDAALIFAGDLSEADAKKLAEKYFGAWTGNPSGSAAASSAVPAPPPPPARKLEIVDKPGSPQTTLIAFGLGVARNNPDYPAINVMNSILGGLFSSRINMNLREKNGFTYGAFSGFFFLRGGGPMFAGAQVRTDVTVPALKELFSELNRIHTDPATPAELKLAKDSSLRSLPADFETVGNETGLMSELFVYNLPRDYFEKLPAQFEAVTAEAVAKAAENYIHPQNLIVMAVGDRAKIQPDMEKLDLGPIELRDESGDLVKK